MAVSDSGIFKVRVLADSRGRGLSKLLNESSDRFHFSVDCLPGATLSSFKQKLKQKDYTPCDLVIIFGGICNVTRIVYMPYRAAVFRYATTMEAVQHYGVECAALLEEAAANVTSPILLTPIVGIDLIKYAGAYNEQLFGMQSMVDAAIPLINNYIKGSNEDRGLITPITSNCIHRCRGKGKGYRTHYIKLTDGCHPSEEVKELWAEALVRCCRLNFPDATTN